MRRQWMPKMISRRRDYVGKVKFNHFFAFGSIRYFFACKWKFSFFPKGLNTNQENALKGKLSVICFGFSGENPGEIANYIFSLEISIIRFEEENKSRWPKKVSKFWSLKQKRNKFGPIFKIRKISFQKQKLLLLHII